jgi:hypothetical protein
LRVDGSRREVAVKGDGHVFVAADAVLDGFGVFGGMDERLPRVNVKYRSSGRQSALIFRNLEMSRLTSVAT